MDGPVRELFERIAPHADPAAPDLGRIGDALLRLAADRDYLSDRIERIRGVSGPHGLHVPEEEEGGPRLMLVHRNAGEMSPVHDHGVWVALAPVVGVETHRRYRADPSDRARIELAEEQALGPATCVTLMPPDDIHEHGHVAGRGDAAYVLILLGGNQFARRRTEWDAAGRAHTLEAGDRGRWLASMPIPT